MRIKDFIYGTLPRKNKKTKKTKNQDHVTVSKKWSHSRDLNKNCGFFPIAYNRHLVSEDFEYKDSGFATCNNSYHLDTFNGYSGHLSPDDVPVFEQVRKESANTSCESAVDGNFNTIPKIRSRIKTNPWLPSPKTSPGPSGTTSPMTSSTVSNGVHEFFRDLDFPRDSIRSVGSEEDYSLNENSESGFYSANCTARGSLYVNDCSNLQNNNRRNCIFYGGEESIESTDHDSIMQNSFLSEECNDIRSQHVVSGNQEILERGEPLQFNYENEFEERVEKQLTDNIGSRDDVFSVFNSQDCLDMDVESGYALDTTTYRETTDTAINTEDYCSGGEYVKEQCNYDNFQEEHKVTDDCSEGKAIPESSTSEDAQKVGLIEYEQQQPRFQSESFSSDIFHSMDKPSDFEENDDCVYNTMKELDSGSDNVAADSITSEVTSPTGSVSFDWEDIEYIDADDADEVNATSESEQGSFESVLSSPAPIHCVPVSHENYSSKVTSVQSSLCDKVRKLKQDKEVVDRIVNKAREEQRIQKQELVRIQKHAALARKEILLTTLVELRQKLDQQTERLQSAYDNIITFRFNDALQKRYSGQF